jgi:hypothetical protein
MDLSPSTPPAGILPKSTAIVLVVGWVGVLIGLAFITAAAQLVDHPVIFGRLAPFFWVLPIWTALSAARRRPVTLPVSVLATVGIFIGGLLDLSRRHPVAGRYELWLAGSALLVTLAGWIAHPSEPVVKA